MFRRQVAIEALLLELGAAIGTDRFLREIRTTVTSTNRTFSNCTTRAYAIAHIVVRRLRRG